MVNSMTLYLEQKYEILSNTSNQQCVHYRMINESISDFYYTCDM
jgi:hypothetical protein